MLGRNSNLSLARSEAVSLPSHSAQSDGVVDATALSVGRQQLVRHAARRRYSREFNLKRIPVSHDAATVRAQQLAKVPLFRDVAIDVLRPIIALARLKRVRVAEFFFNERDEAKEFFVLTSGRVKLTQLTPEGHQVVLGHIGPGEPFGGVGAFGDPTYPVSAETVEPSVALAWTSRTMQRVLETHPTVTLNAVRFVADRLHDLQRRYRQLITERVERRVARALLRLARDAGRRANPGVEIDFPVSRQDIAEMTGTTLFTVSRLMRSWEERGILSGGRRRIVLLKADTLAAIAEDLPSS
jgi:CRP/FNR family transcriptional regulator, nitrogen oxide reductase regulator